MMTEPPSAGKTNIAPLSAAHVRASVIQLLQEIGGFHVSLLTDEARFDRELLMKSIDFVELRVALEDQFDIEVDPLRLIELNRLDRVLSYLTQLASAGEG